MNIFFCFKSDFSHLSLLKYLPASIKSFTSIHFTFYISYWQDFTHIHIICSIYIFEPSLPRQHHGNHTVGYCASYFVFFMNKYVNIFFFLLMVTFPSHPFCPILTFSLFVSSHLPLLPPPHLPTFLPQACPLFLFPMSISCFACYFLQLLAPAIDLYQLNCSHISPESLLLLLRILTLIHLI